MEDDAAVAATAAACRKCGSKRIAESRARAYNWICTSCSNAERDADPERYLARKLAEHLRRRGVAAPYPGVAFVRQILQLHHAAAAAADLHELCIVARDPQREFGLDNALLVTSHDGFALSRCVDETKRRQLLARIATK